MQVKVGKILASVGANGKHAMRFPQAAVAVRLGFARNPYVNSGSWRVGSRPEAHSCEGTARTSPGINAVRLFLVA